MTSTQIKKSRLTGNGMAILALILAVVMLSFSVFQARANARVSSPRSDDVTENSAALDAVGFTMLIQNITTATSTILVDQSDTTNFKHPNTGAVEIFKLRVDWQTNATASTTLRFGVIASSTSAGDLTDIYWFDQMSFASNLDGSGGSNSRQTKEISYMPGVLNARVASGVPSKFLTAIKDTSSSKYATTSTYRSPLGAFVSSPGVGDVVMEVYSQNGAASTTVSGLYRVTE